MRRDCLRCRIVPSPLDPPAHVEPEHTPEISGNDLVWHQLACTEKHVHRAPGCCPPDCTRCAHVGMTPEPMTPPEVAFRLRRTRAEIEAEAADDTMCVPVGKLQLEVLLDIRDLLEANTPPLITFDISHPPVDLRELIPGGKDAG